MPALRPAAAISEGQKVVAEKAEADLIASYGTPMVLAAVTVVVFSFAFAHPALLIHRSSHRFGDDVFYMRAIFRFHVALAGSFLVAWFLQPAANLLLSRWSLRLETGARGKLIAAALVLACVLFAVFIWVFGRWQFGGFDYNIIGEIGWRQILGQRPYVDFPTTSPPLFNAGIAAAFHLLGVRWDSILVLTATFTAVTLVWLFFLLRRVGMSVTAALGTACTLEIATMLPCSFWWYNNTTLVLAAIFFLAAVLLSQRAEDRLGQVSFTASLALLALGKPNIAGVTIAGCTALLLIITRQHRRIVLLTLAGGALTLLLFAAAHISLPAMLQAYRGAAKERGAFSSFGYDEFTQGEKRLIQLWYLALFFPLVSCWRPLGNELESRRWGKAAFWLFFPLSALIAIYGVLGNGETRDVETSVLVCGLSLLAFSLGIESLQLRRYTVALLCAMAASNLYLGMGRDRVYTIGRHMFFEWQDRDHVVSSGPLKNMRVSETFAEMNDEIGQALGRYPGPYFFGPRVDYGYMVFGVPSPEHFPAWWHPGTAFARADMHKIVSGWEQDRFPTMIYLKGTGHQTPFPEVYDPKGPAIVGEQSLDYTYYPASMLNDLRTLYIRDDRYPRITVYHRRPGM